MSDGKTIVVEGDAIERLVETLTELSMVPDGTPLKDALAMGRTFEVADLREVYIKSNYAVVALGSRVVRQLYSGTIARA